MCTQTHTVHVYVYTGWYHSNTWSEYVVSPAYRQVSSKVPCWPVKHVQANYW